NSSNENRGQVTRVTDMVYRSAIGLDLCDGLVAQSSNKLIFSDGSNAAYDCGNTTYPEIEQDEVCFLT
ncbi:MAG: hypothetical protein ACK2TV_14600, partial [Anaerolineales bacterium]